MVGADVRFIYGLSMVYLWFMCGLSMVIWGCQMAKIGPRKIDFSIFLNIKKIFFFRSLTYLTVLVNTFQQHLRPKKKFLKNIFFQENHFSRERETQRQSSRERYQKKSGPRESTRTTFRYEALSIKKTPKNTKNAKKHQKTLKTTKNNKKH